MMGYLITGIVSFLFAIAFPSILLGHSVVASKTFYIDPNIKGSVVTDGSRELPFRSFKDLVHSKLLSSGDEVILRKGRYGSLRIQNLRFEEQIVIKSEAPHAAFFSQIDIRSSSNLSFREITILKDKFTSEKARELLYIDTDSDNIEVVASKIMSAKSSVGWGEKDWNNRVISGVFARGTNIRIVDNEIRNVDFGISTMGKYSVVQGNSIIDFAGDGLRGLGNNSTFENNIVKNCHSVNKNHDDGFQSWSMSPDWKVGVSVVTNVTLRNNLFIANETVDNSPYCEMQGIGLFDGMFENWVIENNIVVVDHWHGITVMGAKNVKILNNTVVDISGRKPGPAWIRITNHKNGKKSQGNLVANNLANSYSFPDGGVLQLKNQVIRNPYGLFVNPDENDYRLLPGSRALGAGMPGLGSQADFFGNHRPLDRKPDLGAIQSVN